MSVSPERTVSLNVCLTVSLNVFQVDESTQDVSVSQLSQSHGADYLEDVAWPPIMHLFASSVFKSVQFDWDDE